MSPIRCISRRSLAILVVSAIGLSAFCLYRHARSLAFEDTIWPSNSDSVFQPTSGPPVPDLSDPDGPFYQWPLTRVCNETKWVDGVVFLCDNNSGGIGNIRNAILTCLRYAIEAGSTAIVLPRIRERSVEDLSALWKDFRPFDYFFDEDHFRTNLQNSCPQMVVYEDTYSIPGLQHPDKYETITPKNYGGIQVGCHGGFPNRHGRDFGRRFHQWIAESAHEFSLPPLSLQDRRLFRFSWGSQFEWPVWIDGPEFVASFGGLLRFRQDILRLGRTTIGLMRKYAQSVGSTGSAAEKTTGFVGIHLRTENDALPAWPTAEDQTAAYLHETASRGFKASYLANGNATEAGKFRARAMKEIGLYVVTKEDLLNSDSSGHALAQLEALSWDQRALVDFLVLTKSDYFLGMSPSSFSMNVALKRHLREDGLYTRPWKIGGGDGRSWLVGKYEDYWEGWLWFYDTIWP